MPWGPDYPLAPRPSTGNTCGIAYAPRGDSENRGPRDRHPQEGISCVPHRSPLGSEFKVSG